MATFKLFSDIVDEEEKIYLQAWGLDGHCYKDIHEFIDSIPEDDDVIDIRIHCRGGVCVEGWAMYDALRQSGKKIYTTVEGECSSMATIILLAAPLERRTAYANAHFCIHNPAVMWLDTDYPRRLTADGIETITEQMKVQAESLREEQQKIINLYTSRTTASAEELQELMNKDTYITASKAQELGFISKTLAPNTAFKTCKNNNFIPMSKPNKEVSVRQSLLDRLLAKCGFSKLEDVVMRDQKITAADGSEFTVEREDGDPQVGDTAYPDGTYTMEDGTVIVIEDNLITSITNPEEEGDGSENKGTAGDGSAAPTDEDDKDQQIADLQKQVSDHETRIGELETTVSDLTAERDSYKSQLESKKDAKVLSDDEKAILDKVAKAGGSKWLDKVLDMRSTFNSRNREFIDHNPTNPAPEGETKTQKAIREAKERYANSKK